MVLMVRPGGPARLASTRDQRYLAGRGQRTIGTVGPFQSHSNKRIIAPFGHWGTGQRASRIESELRWCSFDRHRGLLQCEYSNGSALHGASSCTPRHGGL
jgi:hypothetical protein